MLKKLMVLAAMAMAVAAFAGPAVAQASPAWTVTGTEVPLGGEEEKQSVEGAGNLQFTVATAKTLFPIAYSGSLWNDSEVGQGLIDSAPAQAGSVSGIPGCAVAVSYQNLPWAVSLSGKNTLKIAGFKATFKYNETCQKAGLPGSLTATGTLVGSTSQISGGTRMNISNSELKVGLSSIFVNGYIDFPGYDVH